LTSHPQRTSGFHPSLALTHSKATHQKAFGGKRCFAPTFLMSV
jgi:hypothetical protein